MVKKTTFKCFIGYDDNDDIKPLQTKLTQMIGSAKYFGNNNNKTMSFKVIHRKTV